MKSTGITDRIGSCDEQMTYLLRLGFTANEPPDEKRKAELIKGLPAGRAAKISLPGMVVRQIRYIRPVSRIAAILFLAIALMAIPNLNNDSLWALAACTPFLAVAADLEVRRSYRYGMAEIECTTRFSLRSIAYARFLLVGVLYFAIMLILSVIIHRFVQIRTLIVFSGLLVPYLVTMTGALLLERTAYGRSAPYSSFAAAGLTAAGVFLARYFVPVIMQVQYGSLWEASAVFLTVCVITLFGGNVKMQEAEILWN